MSGTPLNPARFAGLMATVAKSFPLDMLTDEFCKSWEDNGEELASRLTFLAEMAPEPKRKRKARKSTLVNPAEFFVTSEKFYVGPDLARNIDLSPCADDTRELKVLFPLPRNMNDSGVATQAGGLPQLTRQRGTLPQLMHECRLALAGKPRLFVKGGYYLLYIEGRDGELSPVFVHWNGERLCLNDFRFGQNGEWHEGSRVCGN